MRTIALGFAVLGFALIPAISFQAFSDPRCTRPWIFFDLGNTLVDTATYNFEKVQYMPKAYDYLRQLQARGYPMGLLVNIPESWGSDREQKIRRLKAEVSGPKVWIDPNPMLWELFTRTATDDLILIPMMDSERKPGSPKLYQDALALAASDGCAAVFQGEDRAEVARATELGMTGYLVGTDEGFYMPIDEIEKVSGYFWSPSASKALFKSAHSNFAAPGDQK